MPCSLVQLARVVVCVVEHVDVICVMIVVLIALVDVVRAVDTVFVAILAQVVLESSLHPIFMHERLSLTSPSSLSTSTCPSPSSFHSSVLMHPEHYTDLDNLDTVESNLRNSAKGSNDAYDVTQSLTGIEGR